MDRFACSVLNSAAPLVKQLHAVAYDWTQQPKGETVSFDAAVTALCTFPASPCPLFASPRRLLLAAGAHVAAGPHLSSTHPPHRLVSIGEGPVQERLARVASRMPGWEASIVVDSIPPAFSDGARRPRVQFIAAPWTSGSVIYGPEILLLVADGPWRQQLAELKPAVALLFRKGPPTAQSSHAAALLDAEGSSWSIFPFRTAGGSGVSSADLLWRADQCEPPMWERELLRFYPSCRIISSSPASPQPTPF